MLRSTTFLAVGAAILFGSAACSGGDKGPVSVASVQMMKDDGQGNDGDAVTGFHPGDGPMHCVATLNKIDSGSKIGISMIAVDAGGVKNQTILSTVVTTNGITNTGDGKFSLPRPWPVGKYQCAVTLNGAPAKTVNFQVTGG
jgi:hypothetical protein